MEKLQELVKAMAEARKDLMLKADLLSMCYQKLEEARGAYEFADIKYFAIRKEYDIEKRK